MHKSLKFRCIHSNGGLCDHDFLSLSVSHLCPPSSCELNSCMRTADLRGIHSFQCGALSITGLTESFKLQLRGLQKHQTMEALVHQHQVNCNLDITDQKKKIFFFCSMDSEKQWHLFHGFRHFPLGNASSTEREEHNGGKFSITWKGRGDPDVTGWWIFLWKPWSCSARSVLSDWLIFSTFLQLSAVGLTVFNDEKACKRWGIFQQDHLSFSQLVCNKQDFFRR